MTLKTFELLLATPEVLCAAAGFPATEATFLASYGRLSKRYAPELAKAALETMILRSKARDKFPLAERMFFEREALEQSTHHDVAAHRAARFKRYGVVLDLGCGIGGDSLALAAAKCRVIAIENDPLRARIAEANFAVLGAEIPVLRADARAGVLPHCDAIYCDPARRTGGKRYLNTDDYSPSPRDIIARFPDRPIGFKLAPGIARTDLARFDGEAEFVSFAGELKECRLWKGELATTRHRATLLPGGDSLATHEIPVSRTIVEPQRYIYLPDSAVIRAGIETHLAAHLGAAFLDGGQPLLTSDSYVPTPFATTFRFDACLYGSLSRLSKALAERDTGCVTWMNLGSPRDVKSVRESVNLSGDSHRTVILTRIAGAAASLIVEGL